MDVQTLVGEFSELNELIRLENITFNEHPTNNHYQGQVEEREWMSKIKVYYIKVNNSMKNNNR